MLCFLIPCRVKGQCAPSAVVWILLAALLLLAVTGVAVLCRVVCRYLQLE